MNNDTSDFCVGRQSLCQTIWVLGVLIGMLLLAFRTTPPASAQINLACADAPGGSIPVSTLSLSAVEGASVSYEMKLCQLPSQPINVIPKVQVVNAGDENQVSFTPVSGLIFDSSNYSIPQTITVQAIADQLSEVTSTIVISHEISPTDGFYGVSDNGIPLQISIMITDSTITTNNKRLAYFPLVSKMRIPSWTAVGSQGKSIDVVRVHNSSLFAGHRKVGNAGGGIYRESAICRANTLVSNEFSVRDLAFTNNIGVVATFNERVFYSTNNGNNWLPTATTNMNPFVYALVFGNSSGEVFAGTDNGIYRSEDNGKNWSNVAPPSSSVPSYIYSLSFNSGQPTASWVGSYQQGIWQGTLGTSVTLSTKNDGALSAKSEIWEILMDGTDTYIATSDGIYKRSGTSAWSAYGLQGRQVLSIEIITDQQDLPGKYMYAGLNSGGIQRTAMSVSPTWIDTSPPGGSALTVRDLYFDRSSLCNGLLAATSDGIWLYK